MTVDMLAATFFWPEGRLLGAQHPEDPAPGGADAARGPGAEAPPEDDGFWAAVMRNLWRPAADPSTAAAP